VKDAPERLADIIEEIESLSEILTEMEGDRNSCNAIVGPQMQRCVATCRKAVNRFSKYADCMENTMRRHKLRGRAKFALKSESIEEVIARLETSKSNLVLAYMLYREAVADKRAMQVQQQMERIVVGQASLLAQKASVPTFSKMEKGLPATRHRAPGKAIAHVRTPSWLSQTVWEITVKRAISGWTVSLRSRRIVPQESPVAQACMNGDISLLRQVFGRREASPFDEIDFGFRVSNLLSVSIDTFVSSPSFLI
jgi:hypothetical protein